jgi:uncharacterized protein YndB with AHSA1/START domain
MIRYSSEVTIARPPHEVFDALLDPARYAQWTDMVDMSFDGAARPQVGTRGQFRLAKGPIKGMLDVELTELEPDRRVVFQITHQTLDWRAVSVLEPAGTGTRLTYAGEIRLRGWRRLLEPMVAGEARRGEGGEALRLKELLEGSLDPIPTTA